MTRSRVPRSLQWRLSIGLATLVLATGTVAGILSFAWALHDVNEILDGLLEDTADLIASGRMQMPGEPAQLAGSEPENDLLVVPFPTSPKPSAGSLAGTLSLLPDGFGTVRWNGHDWRVLLRRMPGGQRVAIAQQTEVRDEVAYHSAVRTIIPLLVLIPLLALAMRRIVRKTLAPVSALASHVDAHASPRAADLPEIDTPQEIELFVRSIRRLVSDLKTALEHQQRFVANAAHELRSPVAALMLQAENVETVLVDAEARSRMLELRAGIARMQHLLEQLLSMASVEAEGEDPPSAIQLAAVVREMLAESVSSAQASGVDLGAGRCDPQAWIVASPIDVVTLLRNVVGNAMKYGRPGGTITVSVWLDGHDAVLQVLDDGPGMPQEHLQRVFEPFYRVPGTGQAGSGLGLSIVAAIAQRRGGRVALRARESGPGLCFEYRQACAPAPAR